MGKEKEHAHIVVTQKVIAEEITYSDPDVVGLLFHDIRGQMVRLLMEQDLTLRQLSDILQLNPGTTKRHLQELTEKKIIFFCSEIQNQFGITMKYYRATAKRFRIELEFPPNSAEISLNIKEIMPKKQ